MLSGAKNAVTPMMRQYLEIKEQYNDAILFYRLGDFYEMFFDDAILASKLLDITLTTRNKHDNNPVPLCGVPYHSVEPYIAKILENGRRVAICEQVEDPKSAKGVVKREVTRIFTPGVVPEGGHLDAASNNFVAAVFYGEKGIGLAFADISTGLFRAARLGSVSILKEELARIEPKEILVSSDDMKGDLPGALITQLNESEFSGDCISSLKGGNSLSSDAARAAGAVYSYLRYTQKGDPSHIAEIEHYSPGENMRLDGATKRNLEILKTAVDGEVRGSLWWLLSKTETSMGSRLLKEWLCYPLMSVEKINHRLDAVAVLFEQSNLREDLGQILKGISDLERLTTRMTMGTGNARDMLSLARSLAACAKVKDLIADSGGMLNELHVNIDPISDLTQEVFATISDDPPLSVREGGMIHDGIHRELDELRSVRKEGKGNLIRMEAEERERTGIGSLKVRYNKVFGYYIEITNTHRDKVPQDYIRKQTLANAERFITPALKEYEDKVLGAEDRIKDLEYEIFSELRLRMAAKADRIKSTANAVAVLDVLASFANIAREGKYVRPEVDESDLIQIDEGRHPVVEKLQREERFVPNDTLLNGNDRRLMMITGPNMAGKSTVMRQTALIVLMAQIGSFVPAKNAHIGVVDRIFTRIGASDALSKGQSTFMVEMTEAATILREATKKSLVIIDEIGRGTSTFDGLAIAWSIAEDLHDRVRARTMFATHYHELTELKVTREGVKNYQIAVKEWNDRVIFLRRLVPGATSNSYGIQVASLAGLTKTVVERAKEILSNLEGGEFDEIGRPRLALSGEHAVPRDSQMMLFTSHPMMDRLRELDLTTLTPLEALNLLHNWKQSM